MTEPDYKEPPVWRMLISEPIGLILTLGRALSYLAIPFGLLLWVVDNYQLPTLAISGWALLSYVVFSILFYAWSKIYVLYVHKKRLKESK